MRRSAKKDALSVARGELEAMAVLFERVSFIGEGASPRSRDHAERVLLAALRLGRAHRAETERVIAFAKTLPSSKARAS